MVVLAIFIMLVLGLGTVLMRSLVLVLMVVPVPVLMIMSLRLPMVVLGIHLLRQRIILSKRFVMAMLMTAAIRARFRMKRRIDHFDPHANTQQHIPQHSIHFKL